MIDSVNKTLSLEQSKVLELSEHLQSYLCRKRATRRQLECLAGKLCWASHVIPWGRTHIRPVFTLLATLKSPSTSVAYTQFRIQSRGGYTGLIMAIIPKESGIVALSFLSAQIQAFKQAELSALAIGYIVTGIVTSQSSLMSI